MFLLAEMLFCAVELCSVVLPLKRTTRRPTRTTDGVNVDVRATFYSLLRRLYVSITRTLTTVVNSVRFSPEIAQPENSLLVRALVAVSSLYKESSLLFFVEPTNQLLAGVCV